MYSFVVKTAPVGKGRPRVVSRGGKTFAYTPKKTREFEAAVKAAAIRAGVKMYEGPVEVLIECLVPIPKSRRKELGGAMFFPATGRPDVDNVAKAVLDALQGIAYKTDSAVSSVTCKRTWSRLGQMVAVTVMDDSDSLGSLVGVSDRLLDEPAVCEVVLVYGDHPGRPGGVDYGARRIGWGFAQDFCASYAIAALMRALGDGLCIHGSWICMFSVYERDPCGAFWSEDLIECPCGDCRNRLNQVISDYHTKGEVF